MHLILKSWSTDSLANVAFAMALEITPDYFNSLQALQNEVTCTVLAWKTSHLSLIDQTPCVLDLSAPPLHWREPKKIRDGISELNAMLLQRPVLKVSEAIYLRLINNNYRRQEADTQLLRADISCVQWESGLKDCSERIYSAGITYQQLEYLYFPQIERLPTKPASST